MSMNINEIRLLNLRVVLHNEIPGRGQIKKLSARMGWKHQYGSALIGKTPSKNIGGQTARLIENEFRLPRDWLDVTHFDEWIEAGLMEEHSRVSEKNFTPGKQELPLLETAEEIDNWVNRAMNQTVNPVFFPVLPLMQLSNGAYALKETTDMMPPFKPGDVYYVDPDSKPKSGDWCVFNINGTPVVGELEKSFRATRLKFHNDQDDPVEVSLSGCMGVVKIKMMGDFFHSYQ